MKMFINLVEYYNIDFLLITTIKFIHYYDVSATTGCLLQDPNTATRGTPCSPYHLVSRSCTKSSQNLVTEEGNWQLTCTRPIIDCRWLVNIAWQQAVPPADNDMTAQWKSICDWVTVTTHHFSPVLLHLNLLRDDTDNLGALCLAIGQPWQGRVVSSACLLHCTPEAQTGCGYRYVNSWADYCPV